MRIHSVLKHENVLEFINAAVVELKHQHLYVPGIYMLMELAGGGDLFDKIVPDVGVKDDVAHLYFNQLLSGMGYIHSQGVCHRDLKPENILLDAAGCLKISDFGLSAVYKLKESGRTRPLTERCGSLPYVAPELNSDQPYDAEAIDAWGIGVILYAMLAGNTPWDEPTSRSPEFTRYVAGTIYEEKPWSKFSAEALCEPSQLASQSASVLAERLTEQLRANGDLDLAAPNLSDTRRTTDEDGDEEMYSASQAEAAPPRSQFTQTLMLFSQTQSGTRYESVLTRFYASLGHTLLFPIIQEALETLNVKCKVAPSINQEGNQDELSRSLRLRIGGYDARKVVFKGWVEVERFSYRGIVGSYVVMSRDVRTHICDEGITYIVEAAVESPHRVSR
ncbi:hypothetical protein H0H93_006615, partial [Arthromyces matolae]